MREIQKLLLGIQFRVSSLYLIGHKDGHLLIFESLLIIPKHFLDKIIYIFLLLCCRIHESFPLLAKMYLKFHEIDQIFFKFHIMDIVSGHWVVVFHCLFFRGWELLNDDLPFVDLGSHFWVMIEAFCPTDKGSVCEVEELECFGGFD